VFAQNDANKVRRNLGVVQAPVVPRLRAAPQDGQMFSVGHLQQIYCSAIPTVHNAPVTGQHKDPRQRQGQLGLSGFWGLNVGFEDGKKCIQTRLVLLRSMS
jgi:hypothetical protein